MAISKRRALRAQKKVHSPVRAAAAARYLAGARKGREAFLIASALGTGLLALTIGPNAALAACNNPFNPIGNATMTCSGAADTDGATGYATGTLTINISTNVSNPGGVAIDGTGLVGVNLGATGNTVAGQTDGFDLNSVGFINFNNFSGTASGATGDGIDLSATGVVNVNNFSGTATGGQHGMNLSGSVITVGNLTGTAAGGLNGNGINAQVSTGAIIIDNAGTTAKATGGNHGINATATGIGGYIQINNFQGLADGDTGNGINAALTNATSVGGITINNFSGDAEGGNHGINATIAGGGAVSMTNFTGEANGTNGAGINVSVAAGTANLSGFSGDADGGIDGIKINSAIGLVNLDNFSGTADGKTGSGINVTTAGGIVNLNNFTGEADGGTHGISVVNSIGGMINMNNFSGDAEGDSGDGIHLSTLVGNVGMDGFTGDATGGTNGIFAFAGGNIDFSQTSALSLVKGDVNGLNFEQGVGHVDVDLAGQVTGGTTGLLVTSNLPVGLASISDVDVDTVAGSQVRGITGDGISITKTSLGGNVNVTTAGRVWGGASGVGTEVLSIIGGDTTTTINNNGLTEGGAGGISSITASLTGNGTTVVNLNNEELRGGSGIGVLALTGASILSGTGTASTTVNVNAGSGIDAGSGILAGSASLGGLATTNVVIDEEVNANTGFGAIAFAGGADGFANAAVITNNAAVTAAGSGLITIGVNGDATTNVENTIDFGGFVGAGAFAVNGDALVNVNDAISTDTGTFGALAVSFGGNATVISTADGVIDPPSVGMAAGAFGNGTATVTNGALVQANDVGLLAVSISDPLFPFPPGPGAIDINANAAVQSDGIGILAIKGGDGNTNIDVDAAITGIGGATPTGGDGIFAIQTLGAGTINVTTTANGTINAGDDGISINKYFSDGVGGKAVVVNTGAAITALGDGIEITHVVGSGDIDVTTNAAITAAENGIEIVKVLGVGDVNVNVNDDITATGGDGVFAFSGATLGDIRIEQDARTLIDASEDGIQAVSALNAGTTVVNTGFRSSIDAGDDGISIIKVLGLGSAYVNTGNFSSITAVDDGIQVTSVLDVDLTGFTSIDVDTGFASRIVAGDDGIEVTQALSGGDVRVNTGAFSWIDAGDDGINASSYASIGNLTVTTGFASAIFADNDGIVAEAYGGLGFGFVGDVRVNTGDYSFIRAGDDGITAINYNLGFGNGAIVNTGERSWTLADDKGVRAGGWDQVVVNLGEESVLVGGLDTTADGNAVRIFDADLAVVNVGQGALVVGSGANWNGAVISIDAEDATYINIYDDAWVTSRSLFAPNGLAAAAGDLVIDTDGAATDIDNWGTLIGRVGLTDENDVLNNYSSDSWYTVGANYFGDGYDEVNNYGRTVTALEGGVAETTSFYDLEDFSNGSPWGINDGILTMVDNDTRGAYDTRDVTYTSGTFTGRSAGPLGTYGNSTLGVDAFLGGPGTTSDVLEVGGHDELGAPIVGQTTFGTTEIYVNDVNPGPGAYNPDGILVVDVLHGDTYGKYNNAGQDANFVISPYSANYDPKFGGVIDKGLFFYDIVTMADGTGGTGHYLVGLPDEEVFQLPSLITGAQSIWHDTTGVWLDRQVDLRSYLLNPVEVAPAQTIVSKEKGLVTKAPAYVTPNITPGVWGKALGSWGSRDSSSNYSFGNANYNYDTGYDQDTYGFIAGADFGKTTGDSAWIFGVLGGYINSKMDFNSSGTTAEYSGGTVGGYVTYLSGGWFIDGLVKADFLSLDYDAPSLMGIGYRGESSDVTNVGVVIDTGYRIPWTGSVWFEPVATLSYVNTQIDDLNGIEDTTVQFQDGDSLRGALGARIGGKVYDAETYWVEASATARYWYEFEGNNTAWILNPGDDFAAVDNFDGSFGEITGSLNVFGKGNGWNGFLNGSFMFGDDYDSGSARVGVRYQW